MRTKLLEILVCPKCEGSLLPVDVGYDAAGNIESGALRCPPCANVYPIHGGIPRFVPMENYASSFGLQWNLFRAEQIDSINGLPASRNRFFAETGWTPESLSGKLVLDAGCGAGRFLDVAANYACDAVGVDLSNSVDAAKQNLTGRRNVDFVQASIYELPFRRDTFDAAYCLGVIQHTPDPSAAIAAIPRVVKSGGDVAYFIYKKKRWTLFYSKYLVRPLTTRLPERLLLALIKITMPFLFVLTEILFRIPLLGRYFAFAIPVANYVGANNRQPGLTAKQRYRWAIMDTFDMLAPTFDQPQIEADVRAVLERAGVTNVRLTAPYALCLNGTKE
jgi:ubiquinone/menaquinone biosynthesis C-methylase UbiE/uncharacterized protein YbaR (Trm112 family)